MSIKIVCGLTKVNIECTWVSWNVISASTKRFFTSSLGRSDNDGHRTNRAKFFCFNNVTSSGDRHIGKLKNVSCLGWFDRHPHSWPVIRNSSRIFCQSAGRRENYTALELSQYRDKKNNIVLTISVPNISYFFFRLNENIDHIYQSPLSLLATTGWLPAFRHGNNRTTAKISLNLKHYKQRYTNQPLLCRKKPIDWKHAGCGIRRRWIFFCTTITDYLTYIYNIFTVARLQSTALHNILVPGGSAVRKFAL